MKPCLKHRRFVEVFTGKTWKSILKHRVYSCPDTNEYDRISTASGLILLNRNTGARVPLEVTSVTRLDADNRNQVDALSEPLRVRARNYLDQVQEIPGIIQAGRPHRLYFLGEEPWPDWLQGLTATTPDSEWVAILSICNEPDRFFEWPQVGELLWPECSRGNNGEEHLYPAHVAERLLKSGISKPDKRSNGPAIMAFLATGGKRPVWGNEGWPIHHIYDRTGPVPNHPRPVPHAVKEGHLFTHSGGLVAAHPVAHHLAHQSALLKWLLRREAFLRFRFDPMGVFVDL